MTEGYAPFTGIIIITANCIPRDLIGEMKMEETDIKKDLTL